MRSLKNFIFYNNTIPILFGILFLGASATFAASPEARELVVTSETRLASIDNSLLLDTAITDSTVSIQINAVSEDDTTYYVEYELTTIGVRDGVWQPLTKTALLKVSKDTVAGMDLGLYVAEELDELHAFETRKLLETQAAERAVGVTPKVVATEYDGLVGQFFDPELQMFPAYDPLIQPDVGVPLSSEQQAAHEVVRRLIEEEREKREQELRAQEQTGDSGASQAPESPQEPVPSPSPQTPPEEVIPPTDPEPISEEKPLTDMPPEEVGPNPVAEPIEDTLEVPSPISAL